MDEPSKGPNAGAIVGWVILALVVIALIAFGVFALFNRNKFDKWIPNRFKAGTKKLKDGAEPGPGVTGSPFDAASFNDLTAESGTMDFEMKTGKIGMDSQVSVTVDLSSAAKPRGSPFQ